MSTYYVSESISYLFMVDQPNDPERISSEHTFGSNFYIVRSVKYMMTRAMRVFSHIGDGKKDYEESKKYCTPDSGAQRVVLWEVTAFTRKGAAKKALKGQGEKLSMSQISDDEIKANNLDLIKGELLLSAFEGGASNEAISEISKDFDSLVASKSE